MFKKGYTKFILVTVVVVLSGISVHYFYPDLINLNLNTFFHAPERLFDSKELSLYRGDGDHKKLYISILGMVFDVTKGAKHYGPGASYHAFTGKDASRAFVTGEFDEEKSSDAVLDLSSQELRSLHEWRKFYEKTYTYKGKLIGRYYDKTGAMTWYSQLLEKRIKDAEVEELEKSYQKTVFPSCNVAWNSDQGTKVWCTTKSGGVDRNWVGVPRKLYEPGLKTSRCACVNLDYMLHANLEEYENCASDSASCYIKE